MNQLQNIMSTRNIRIGITVLIGLFVLLIVYLAFPKSYIKMSTAPSVMNLKIDNGSTQEVKTGQTRLITAGTHKYTFSREGFATETVTLTAGNNETKELLFVLSAQTDEARAILKNENLASHTIQENYASKQEAAYADTVTKNYPILKDLPIVLHSLTIDSCASQKYPNDPTKIALCIYSDDPTGASMIAGPVLAKMGYKISDYEVIYNTTFEYR